MIQQFSMQAVFWRVLLSFGVFVVVMSITPDIEAFSTIACADLIWLAIHSLRWL